MASKITFIFTKVLNYTFQNNTIPIFKNWSLFTLVTYRIFAFQQERKTRAFAQGLSGRKRCRRMP
jgi:hypothetical protein